MELLAHNYQRVSAEFLSPRWDSVCHPLALCSHARWWRLTSARLRPTTPEIGFSWPSAGVNNPTDWHREALRPLIGRVF